VFGSAIFRGSSKFATEEIMKAIRALALVSVLSFWANTQSSALPLYLSPSLPPDLNVGTPGDVTYDSSTSDFEALGYLADYTGGSVTLSYGDVFNLAATINGSGALTAGTLSIFGDVGSGYEALLTGDLATGSSGTAWGYNNGGNVNWFSFLFTVTGGNADVVSDFGGAGAAGGINLYAQFSSTPGSTPFSGTWGGDFNNNALDAYNGNAYADVFPVPEPSSSMLLLVGGALCAAARRRARAR
jgi:hypothetical protein